MAPNDNKPSLVQGSDLVQILHLASAWPMLTQFTGEYQSQDLNEMMISCYGAALGVYVRATFDIFFTSCL